MFDSPDRFPPFTSKYGNIDVNNTPSLVFLAARERLVVSKRYPAEVGQTYLPLVEDNFPEPYGCCHRAPHVIEP